MNENENFSTSNLNPVENTDLNMQNPVEGNTVEPSVNVFPTATETPAMSETPVASEAQVMNETPVMSEIPTISIEPTNTLNQENSTPNVEFNSMNGGVGNDPLPNNSFVNQNMDVNMGNAPVNNNGPKKTNKGLIIGLAIALVAVIALISGGLIYLNGFTAEKFVEDNAKEINSWIDKAFNNVEYNSYDLNSVDVKNSGTITFTTDSKELSDLNGLSIAFNSELSLKNEFESVDLKLSKNGTNLLSGNLFLDKNTYYFESSDLYSLPIKTNVDVNIFQSFKDEKILDTFTVDNIKSLMKSSIDGLEAAIKEANLTTKKNGLTVEYKYEITEENAEKVSNKFEEVMNKNSAYTRFKEFFEENGSFELTKIEPMTVTISVNALTNEIEKFIVEKDNEQYLGTKIGKNKYKVGNDEEYSEFEFTDDSITIIDYTNGKKDAELKIESKKDTISLLIDIEGVKAELNVTSKSEKETDATINVKVADQTYNLKISAASEYGENIAKKKSYTNAVDAEALTEYDMQMISMKFMNILGSNFSSLIESFSGVGTGDVETNFDDFDLNI